MVEGVSTKCCHLAKKYRKFFHYSDRYGAKKILCIAKFLVSRGAFEWQKRNAWHHKTSTVLSSESSATTETLN